MWKESDLQSSHSQEMKALCPAARLGLMPPRKSFRTWFITEESAVEESRNLHPTVKGNEKPQDRNEKTLT